MPMHDWTRVSDGTYHAFHLAWIGAIQACLNGGGLPPGYDALAEQIAGPLGPDVLAAAGDALPAGPLFFAHERYVLVPLEEPNQEAYR